MHQNKAALYLRRRIWQWGSFWWFFHPKCITENKVQTVNMVIAARIRSFHTQQETATDNATSVSPSALKPHPLGSSTTEEHAMSTHFCHALGTGLDPPKAENSRIAIFVMLTPDTFSELLLSCNSNPCSTTGILQGPVEMISLLSASVSHPKIRSNPHLYLWIKTVINLGSNGPKNQEKKPGLL